MAFVRAGAPVTAPSAVRKTSSTSDSASFSMDTLNVSVVAPAAMTTLPDPWTRSAPGSASVLAPSASVVVDQETVRAVATSAVRVAVKVADAVSACPVPSAPSATVALSAAMNTAAVSSSVKLMAPLLPIPSSIDVPDSVPETMMVSTGSTMLSSFGVTTRFAETVVASAELVGKVRVAAANV